MRFSVWPALGVLLAGVVVVVAVHLHSLQGHNKTCHYQNWAAPCRTTSLYLDWFDAAFLAGAVGAAIAAGVIAGSRKR